MTKTTPPHLEFSTLAHPRYICATHPSVRIYGLKREGEGGGEYFKGGFRKLFKLEQNPLNETQLEIQLAKT